MSSPQRTQYFYWEKAIFHRSGVISGVCRDWGTEPWGCTLQHGPRSQLWLINSDPLLLLSGGEERHALTKWQGRDSGRLWQLPLAPGAFEESCLLPVPQRQHRSGFQTIKQRDSPVGLNSFLTHTEPSSFLPLSTRPIKLDMRLQLVKVPQSEKGLYDNQQLLRLPSRSVVPKRGLVIVYSETAIK